MCSTMLLLRGGQQPVANSVPDTQPITLQHPKSFHRSELPGSIPAAPVVRRAEQSPGAAANLHDFSSLARTRRVRIPDRSRAPRIGAVGFGSAALVNRPARPVPNCYRMR